MFVELVTATSADLHVDCCRSKRKSLPVLCGVTAIQRSILPTNLEKTSMRSPP